MKLRFVYRLEIDEIAYVMDVDRSLIASAIAEGTLCIKETMK